ncbi:MAG: hypothetical protein WCV90_00315 [Candidatus Woesearchaeota archaeon]|jgi:hypothetical protein
MVHDAKDIIELQYSTRPSSLIVHSYPLKGDASEGIYLGYRVEGYSNAGLNSRYFEFKTDVWMDLALPPRISRVTFEQDGLTIKVGRTQVWCPDFRDLFEALKYCCQDRAFCNHPELVKPSGAHLTLYFGIEGTEREQQYSRKYLLDPLSKVPEEKAERVVNSFLTEIGTQYSRIDSLCGLFIPTFVNMKALSTSLEVVLAREGVRKV